MSAYDEDVTISLGLTDDDALKTAQNLRTKIEREFKRPGKAGFTDGIKASLASAYNQIDKFSSKIKDIQSLRITMPTQQFSNTREKLHEVRNEALLAHESLTRMIKAGISNDGDTFVKTLMKARELRHEFGGLAGQMRDMQAQGRNTIKVLPPGEQERLLRYTQSLNAVNNRIVALMSSSNKSSGAITRLARSMKGLVATRIHRGIEKLRTALRSLRPSTEDASKGFKKGLKTILKYGFGIRSVFFLVRRLRRTMKEGWGEMAQYSDPFNRSLSEVVTSFAYLKRALATTFAPLVTVVSPILSAFMDNLVEVMNTVGMFFAQLTGQQTFIRAKKVYVDYAKSLEGAGDSADNTTKSTEKQTKALKEQLKTISGFDDVEILHENKDSGIENAGNTALNNTGDVGQVLYETVSPYTSKMAEKFKDIFDVFRKAWDQEGANTIKAAKYALGELKNAAKLVGETFYKVFTDGYGFDWLVSCLRLLQTILYIIGDIAKAFSTAWTKDNNGYNLLARFFEMLTSINNLLVDIGESFRIAWNSGYGVSIISHILHIFTNIFDIIGNIAEGLREAWNEDNVGVSIWENLLGILDDLLATIDDITKSTAEWADELNFTPLLSSIDRLLGSFKNLAKILEDKLAWAWKNILEPLGKWTIEDAVPAALNVIASAFDLIATVADTAWKNILEPFMEKFVSPLASKIGDVVVTKLDTIAQFLKDVSENENAVAFLSGIATAILAIVAAKTAWAAITGILTGALTLLIAHPIVALFVALGLAILALITYWDDLREAVATWWDEVVVGKFRDAQKDFAALGDAIVNGIIEPIKNFFKGIGKWIKETIVDPFVQWIKDLFGINSPSTVMQEIGTFIIQGLFGGILDKLVGVGTWIRDNIFTPIKDGIKNAFGIVGEKAEKIVTQGKAIAGGLKDGVKNKLSDIKTWARENVFEKVKSGIDKAFGIAGGVASKVKSVGKAIVSGVKDGSSNRWKDLPNFFTNSMGDITKAFTNTDWLSLGKDIVYGIGDGLNNAWDWLVETGTGLASNLYDSVCSFLGIASPSKLFRFGVGENITAGIALGISDGEGDAIKSLTALSNSIAKVPFEVPDIAGGKVVPYQATIETQHNNQLQEVIDALNNPNNSITREDMRDVMTEVFKKFMNIDFYIGDEQIARHNNNGQARLNKRMSLATNRG